MSPNIMTEARLLIASIATGTGLSLFYGFLRIWRRLVPHGWVWTGIEDIAFWSFSGFVVFYLLYRENDGALRLYVIGTILFVMAVGGHIQNILLRKVLKRGRKYLKMKK